MYRWEMDGPAEQEFANLGRAAQMALTALLDAVVIADPVHTSAGQMSPLTRPRRCARSISASITKDSSPY